MNAALRTFRAEMVKLRRPRVVVVAAVATVVFSVATAAIVLVAAEPAPTGPGQGPGPRTTIESLSAPGGGTEVFTTGASFAGTFLFVLFVGAIAAEFSRGTVRTMLLRQPRRIPLLAGKLAALLAFAAVVLAAAEGLTWIAARGLAPGHGIPTSEWTTLTAASAAVADYGTVLFWVAGYATLGMAVAVLLRSVPVALAVGIAWAGPFEHLLQDAWDPATRFFPGLLLEVFVAGGTAEVSASRALVTVALYAAAGLGVAATTFARRDVAS